MKTAAEWAADRAQTALNYAQTLYRLLDKGQREGIRLRAFAHLPADCNGPERLVATVAGSRGNEYFVAAGLGGEEEGCTCRGYAGYGYCKHYALTLHTAGWLPDLDELAERLDGLQAEAATAPWETAAAAD